MENWNYVEIFLFTIVKFIIENLIFLKPWKNVLHATSVSW